MLGDDDPCDYCGADAGHECLPDCLTYEPTSDELAQDAADVGSL